jgi:hypothetical protein
MSFFSVPCIYLWSDLEVSREWGPNRILFRTPITIYRENKKQRNKIQIWRSQGRASSYDSNKSTNKMQQFYKFITWRLCVAQHASAVSTHIIRSIKVQEEPLVLSLEGSGWSVVGRGPAGYNRPNHDQQRCYHYAPTVKLEAPSALVCSWWWAGRRTKHVEPHINVK